MKTYQVELKRVSYVTMNVEAETEDAAEDAAWDELASDGRWNDGDADWTVNSIEEDSK